MSTTVTVVEEVIDVTVQEQTVTANVTEQAAATVTVDTGVTDHGALTGLDDDDHSQYLTTARHADISGNPHGVTAEQAGALPLTGGTLTGPLTLDADPAEALHAATKQYVDAQSGGASDIGDLTAAGFAEDDFAQWDGSQFVNRTPAQVLAAIGAVPLTGGTMTGPLGVGISPSYNLDTLGPFRVRYQTDTGGNNFLIGSGYELDGTPHSQGGFNAYVRWGQGGYGASSWGLIFGTAANQIMKLSASGVAFGDVDMSFKKSVSWGTSSRVAQLIDSATLGGSPHNGAIVFGDGSGWRFYFRNDSRNLVTIHDSGRVGIVNQQSITNAITDIATLGHNSTGTPAAGFGAGLLYQLESSTTENRNAARIAAVWQTATDASRKADLVLSAYDTAEREFLRGRGNGSAPAIGFLGATPAIQQAHIADPDGGTRIDTEARAAINSILDVLETFGLVATS